MKQKIILGWVLSVLLTQVVLAGSLNPVSAPTAGTMKPLDQVEPRIPITSVPYTISTSGSYYLTQNLTASVTAIIINADDVTLDLGGFTLTGPGSSYGILMNGRSNVEIRNGTIRNFTYGIFENSTSSKNHRVYNIRALSNSLRGISLGGNNCQIRDCTVSDITVSTPSSFIYGIYLGVGGLVDNCSIMNVGNNAVATSYVYGILANNGNKVSNNLIHDNGSSVAGAVYGIVAGNANTITGNTIYCNGTSVTIANVYGINANVGNTISGNTVWGNGTSAVGTAYGVYASSGSTVSDNVIYNNGNSSTGTYVYGLSVSSGCSVVGNTVRSNGSGASGTVYGIYLGTYCLANNNTTYNNVGTTAGINLYSQTGCVLGTNVAP